MKAERRNITQPADWWEAFAAASEASGQNLSQWMGDACRRRLSKPERERLSKRVLQGQPKAK